MERPQTFDPAPRPMGRRYCLITPCRNEAKFIERTLESTCAQSVLPALWVIVDDGSTDATPEILARYADQHDFIKVIKRHDRGVRAVGPGVVEAFYDGLSRVDLDQFDYVTKYDGDLEVPPRYFERAMELMEGDPYLGNVSGKLFEYHRGRLEEDPSSDDNAVGPIKFYRVKCFQDIGGFVREVEWDGIDGHVCRMNGWIASSVGDHEMRILHLRPMGSSQQNIHVGRIRWGRGKYFMGSSWYYVLVSAIYRSMRRPYLIGGFWIFYGYLKAAATGHKRYDNPECRRYIRRFERDQLLRGRGRALAAENERVRSSGPAPSSSADSHRDSTALLAEAG